MTFDYTKPTVQMLGRWQPWHDGHTELFKRCLAITGQVCIMVRDVGGSDVFVDVQKNLSEKGFTYGEEYFIIKVPNIVDISYGRGVGYTFTEHDLGKEVHDISATKIRAKLREEGKLAAKY